MFPLVLCHVIVTVVSAVGLLLEREVIRFHGLFQESVCRNLVHVYALVLVLMISGKGRIRLCGGFGFIRTEGKMGVFQIGRLLVDFLLVMTSSGFTFMNSISDFFCVSSLMCSFGCVVTKIELGSLHLLLELGSESLAVFFDVVCSV